MNPVRSIALLPLLLCLGSPASATDNDPMNRVALRAEAQQSVNQDQLRVVLFHEAQDSDPARLARNVSEQLNRAMQQAREAHGVRVSSGSRRAHPIQDEQGKKIIAWRERAELIIEGSDFAAISSLTGQLLGPLSLAEMQFSLSATQRQQTEDLLIAEAIRAFQNRARLASEALGGSGYRLVSLNLNTQFSQPPFMPRALKMSSAMDMEMAAPQLEAGQSDVLVSADGVIEVNMP